MIISCPKCKKKFDIQDKLIPANGRLLQCSSCNNKWFFKKDIKKIKETKKIQRISVGAKISQIPKETEEIINEAESTKVISSKKVSKKKLPFLNILLVLIITIIATTILLDTFKMQINQVFPSFIFFLENFYESLTDLFLFIKDLLK